MGGWCWCLGGAGGAGGGCGAGLGRGGGGGWVEQDIRRFTNNAPTLQPDDTTRHQIFWSVTACLKPVSVPLTTG